MARTPKDPTAPIRLKASRYPGVDEGTACTQSSFKANNKAFLYIGMQGGRYKAMFKLQQSTTQAEKLAGQEPACYEVGRNGWVTARFTAERPIPTRVWQKWLDESHALTAAAGSTGRTPRKKAARKTETKTGKKARTSKKKTARKSPAMKRK